MPFNPRISTLVLATMALTACSSLVQLQPGAQAIRVSYPSEVTNCSAHGGVHVSVLDKVGPFDRSEFSVEEELSILARNSVLTTGGDTIVASGPVVDGGRDFNVYVCHK